ncbi:MAG: hypothetical protein HDKAJFGB_00611 [Anaerolineae bacterium]|nr:hypothetical protein [Anaerolineae bacterium]
MRDKQIRKFKRQRARQRRHAPQAAPIFAQRRITQQGVHAHAREIEMQRREQFEVTIRQRIREEIDEEVRRIKQRGLNIAAKRHAAKNVWIP